MERRGYGCRHIFVVSFVSIFIDKKLSCEDIEEFKKDFGHEIHLEGVSFKQYGGKKEFKYFCDHTKLEEFRSYLGNWLKDRSFPLNFSSVGDNLSLTAYEELSDEQIHEFEEEFDVKCRGYSITCGSKSWNYEFR